MKRPTWSEVLAAPDDKGSHLRGWCTNCLVSAFPGWRWCEYVSDLTPAEQRMFALFCILAEGRGR